MSPAAIPQLSVIIIATRRSRILEMVLRQLDRQSRAHALECILVASDAARFAGLADKYKALGAIRIVEQESVRNEGSAKYAGFLASRAPLVAFLEDHTFPAVDWAEIMINSHATRQYAVTGPVVQNANPFNAASWGCFLVYYGDACFAKSDEELASLPANHSCYQREVLASYGERLQSLLEMEVVFHYELLNKGHRLHQAPRARVYHLNYSNLASACHEYFFGSRLFAAQRSHGWGAFKKMVYSLGSPLLPMIRIRRINEIRKKYGMGGRRFGGALGAVLAILTAGAAGEMLGYAMGPADSASRLVDVLRRRIDQFSGSELDKVEKRLWEQSMHMESGR